jgi:plastocyanin
MRVISLAAGLALFAAACGGDKKANDQQAAAATPAPQAAAPAASAGATHDVDMHFDGKKGWFDPATLTIKSNDVVRFHNKSGGPHNVSFWPDSIPAGAAAALDAGIKEKMGPLQSAMVVDPNGVIEIGFPNAPAGVYKFYCLPHLTYGMKGAITVQ